MQADLNQFKNVIKSKITMADWTGIKNYSSAFNTFACGCSASVNFCNDTKVSNTNLLHVQFTNLSQYFMCYDTMFAQVDFNIV